MTEADEIVEAMRQIGFSPAKATNRLSPVGGTVGFEATGPGGYRCTERRAVAPCFYISRDSGPMGMARGRRYAYYFPRRADGIPKRWSDPVIFEADLSGDGDGGYLTGTMREVFEWASGGGGCNTTHTILASREPAAVAWCEGVVELLQPRLSEPQGMVIADQLEYEGLISNRDVATWDPKAVRRFWMATNASATPNPTKRRLMR